MSDAASDHTRLILVRHGESNATVQGIFGGEKSCTGLSELGRRQAEALRARIAAGGEPAVDVLYASTMPRAIETAEIIQPALGQLELHTEVDLVEHRPGAADGMKYPDVTDTYGPIDFHGRPHLAFAPDAESLETFFFRTSEAFERLLSAHRGQTVMVACHGGVVDIAFRHFLSLPKRGHFNLWTLNTAITEFSVDDHGDQRGTWRLVRYNDHSHLAGLPVETPRAPTAS